jgi:hypothetical protein
MYFSTIEGKPKYIYKPLDMSFEEFETNWEPQQMAEYESKGITWIKNIYWRLTEISCVLVLRNKKWFKDNIITLQETWEIILKERQTGCEHRAPARRSKKEPALEESNCLLTLDKMSGKVSLNTSGKSSRSNSIIDGPFFKVRTESMDETKLSL